MSKEVFKPRKVGKFDISDISRIYSEKYPFNFQIRYHDERYFSIGENEYAAKQIGIKTVDNVAKLLSKYEFKPIINEHMQKFEKEVSAIGVMIFSGPYSLVAESDRTEIKLYSEGRSYSFIDVSCASVSIAKIKRVLKEVERALKKEE